MIAEKVAPVADETVAFRLTFTKARQRRPENLDDFESVILRLKDDRWMHEGAPPRPGKRRQDDYALQLLRRAIDEAGEPVPGQAQHISRVPISLWERYCETHDLSVADKLEDRTRAFRKAVIKLQDSGKIVTKRRYAWIS